MAKIPVYLLKGPSIIATLPFPSWDKTRIEDIFYREDIDFAVETHLPPDPAQVIDELIFLGIPPEPPHQNFIVGEPDIHKSVGLLRQYGFDKYVHPSRR